jgi:hypothetical protein
MASFTGLRPSRISRHAARSCAMLFDGAWGYIQLARNFLL